MNTKIFDVRDIQDNKSLLIENLKEAADMLSSGGTVAFPTETVYGLGANALNESAVKKIYEAKGRPSDNPLIVHIAEFNQLDDIVIEVPDKARLIMNKFWPGPISIIMNKKEGIPDCVTAGLNTVAVRMPKNPEAAVLLKLSGCPVAAPSANLSGKPSPTKPEHVIHDLTGRVNGIISGKDCDVGIESTVIDVTVNPPIILRPGIITKEDLEKVIGPVLIAPRKDLTTKIPKAPGMKYTHYAPDAPMVLFEEGSGNVFDKLTARAAKELSSGKRIGIIATDEIVEKYNEFFSSYLAEFDNTDSKTLTILSIGSRKNLKTVAHNVFGVLRNFDEIGVDIILSEAFDAEGIGFSIMNRMDKAATEIK